MSQEFLNRTNVIPGFQKVGSEGVPQGVGGRSFADAGAQDGQLEGPGDCTLVQVPAYLLAGARIDADRGRGKDELPAEFATGATRLRPVPWCYRPRTRLPQDDLWLVCDTIFLVASDCGETG